MNQTSYYRGGFASRIDYLSKEKDLLGKKHDRYRSKSHSKECPFQPDIGELNREIGDAGESQKQI